MGAHGLVIAGDQGSEGWHASLCLSPHLPSHLSLLPPQSSSDEESPSDNDDSGDSDFAASDGSSSDEEASMEGVVEESSGEGGGGCSLYYYWMGSDEPRLCLKALRVYGLMRGNKRDVQLSLSPPR